MLIRVERSKKKGQRKFFANKIRLKTNFIVKNNPFLLIQCIALAFYLANKKIMY